MRVVCASVYLLCDHRLIVCVCVWVTLWWMRFPGEDVEYVMSVHCAQVTWMFNGRDLEAGGRVVIRSSGELIISDLEVADSGNYTCAIWGLAGE